MHALISAPCKDKSIVTGCCESLISPSRRWVRMMEGPGGQACRCHAVMPSWWALFRLLASFCGWWVCFVLLGHRAFFLSGFSLLFFICGWRSIYFYFYNFFCLYICYIFPSAFIFYHYISVVIVTVVVIIVLLRWRRHRKVKVLLKTLMLQRSCIPLMPLHNSCFISHSYFSFSE